MRHAHGVSRISLCPTMRLINVKTLQLEDRPDRNGSYAVLSHTWAHDSRGEIGLADFQKEATTGALNDHPGFQKIKGGCVVAARAGLQYLWVDTCCVDQSNSAELGRSINSMFRWYKESGECIVYLSDLSITAVSWRTRLRSCRWFQRGWTLQELIAPSSVNFYDRNWVWLGTRKGLSDIISGITQIPTAILTNGPATLDSLCVAQRMSWASRRTTTVPEDMAYCLFGLFNVNLPLTYGEGGEKAFLRLQEEILRTTDDESIFAWHVAENEAETLQFSGLLAKSPSAFRASKRMQHAVFRLRDDSSQVTMSQGRIDLSLCVRARNSHGMYTAVLSCLFLEDNGKSSEVAIMLQQLSEFQFCRVFPHQIYKGTFSVGQGIAIRRIFVKHEHSWPKPIPDFVIKPPPDIYTDAEKAQMHGAELKAISWYPAEKFLKANGDYLICRTESRSRHTSWASPTEKMADITTVRSVVEGVVTYAIDCKMRKRASWLPPGTPGLLSDLLTAKDGDTVRLHTFDVVFGYHCLKNKNGTVTQRLFPWSTVRTHERRPHGEPGPAQDRALKHWYETLEGLVQGARSSRYELPMSPYRIFKNDARGMPSYVTRHVAISMQDEIVAIGLSHVISVRPVGHAVWLRDRYVEET